MTDETTGVVIVFGIDPAGRTRAARFPSAHEPLARRAAESLGFHVLVAGAGGEANDVPVGRPDRPLSSFAPRVKPATYDRLAKLLAAVEAAQPSPSAEPKDLPVRDFQRVQREPSSSTDPWKALNVGSRILATEPGMDGWWEAKVVGVSPKGKMLICRWADAYDEPTFMAPRIKVGLLRPKPGPKPKLK